MSIKDITVIKTLSKKYFIPDLSAADFPAGTDCLLKSSLDETDILSCKAALLITDNANLIRAFVNRKLKNSYAVYIGDPLAIGAAFDSVIDVWSPFDGGVLLKKRYLLLLDYIRCRTKRNEHSGRRRKSDK